ncbi:MAG: PAS domain S-box protein [Bacteroidales bacterium]|nr:PAS domain S-box protein [Bacteroidales bacterium]
MADPVPVILVCGNNEHLIRKIHEHCSDGWARYDHARHVNEFPAKMTRLVRLVMLVVGDSSSPEAREWFGMVMRARKRHRLPLMVLSGTPWSEFDPTAGLTAPDCWYSGDDLQWLASKARSLVQEYCERQKEKKEMRKLRLNYRESLKNYERTLHNIIDLVPGGIILLNQRGTILLSNAAAADILGVKPGTESRDICVFDLVIPQDREKATGRLSERFSSRNEGGSFQYRIITPGGEQKRVEVSGRVVNWCGQEADLLLISDITSKRRDEMLATLQEEMSLHGAREWRGDHVMNRILNVFTGTGVVDAAAIFLYNTANELRLTAYDGLLAPEKASRNVENGHILTIPGISGEMEVFGTYDPDRHAPLEIPPEESFRAIGVIPLTSEGQVLGVLFVASRNKKEFCPEDREVIRMVAFRFTDIIVVEHARSKMAENNALLEQMVALRTQELEKSHIKLRKEVEYHHSTRISLEASEVFYRSIFESTSDAIVVIDSEKWNVIAYNPHALRIAGISAEELVKTPFNLPDIPGGDSFISEIIKNVREKQRHYAELDYRRNDGTELHLMMQGIWLDIHGRNYIMFVITDITKIKDYQLQLQQNQEKLKSFQENLPVGIFQTNLQGRFLYVNSAVVHMLGYDREDQVMALKVTDIYNNPEEREYNTAVLVKNGQLVYHEMMLRRKNGEPFPVLINVRAVYGPDDQITHFDGVVEDISDRKKAEAALESAHQEILSLNRNLELRIRKELKKRNEQQQFLIQKSKLESLGELAAGIAHEINQPLGVIALSLENLDARLASGRATSGYVKEKLGSVFSNIEKIRDIINHIRIFSRDQKAMIFEQIDINRTVRNTLGLIRIQYRNHHVELETELQEGIGFTIGNPLKLEQVLVNLLSNAKYAVDKKALTQGTKNYQKKITIRTMCTAYHLIIEVEDNGTGIPAANMSRIFDPFYTTKEEGVGTGLGLSIVYGIIREMNGDVRARSKKDQFTVVTLHLPRFTDSKDIDKKHDHGTDKHFGG